MLTSMGIRSRRMRLVGTFVYGVVGSWGDIGQFFVPGAAGTLLRDLSYFPDAPLALQRWVLSAWLVVGIALILVGHVIAHRKAHAAAH